nr:hypothetical protein [Tanacetum cinerariifolium]
MYWSLTNNEGKTSFEVKPDFKPLQLKTFPDVRALLLSDDEMIKESDNEEVFAAGEEMYKDIPPSDEEVQSPAPNTYKPESSQAQNSDESDYDSSSPELNKYDNILPLTKRQLGEHVTIEDDTKKAKSNKAEEEPKRAVSISTIKTIIRPNPKVALIESSSRPLLTDLILEIHEEVKNIGLDAKTIINAKVGPIIQKKQNIIVKDLMISLEKRYERLKKIPKELRIQSTLLGPIFEQALSQSIGRKRKHMELEPKIKVHG